MPFNVSGGTPAQQALVRDQAVEMLNHLNRITDPRLRRCIERKVYGNDTVHIGGSGFEGFFDTSCEDQANLGGYVLTSGIFFVSKSRDIHICVENLQRLLQAGSRFPVWAAMMHEWAHTCCWDHGEGKGVPRGWENF